MKIKLIILTLIAFLLIPKTQAAIDPSIQIRIKLLEAQIALLKLQIEEILRKINVPTIAPEYPSTPILPAPQPMPVASPPIVSPPMKEKNFNLPINNQPKGPMCKNCAQA